MEGGAFSFDCGQSMGRTYVSDSRGWKLGCKKTCETNWEQQQRRFQIYCGRLKRGGTYRQHQGQKSPPLLWSGKR